VATLLLSDDSETVQRLVTMTFADQDIQVIAVGDGDEAIARIRRDRPDIVLASIATPKRNGYDVAAFVKSTPELASIPVLLLAAAFEPVDQVRVAQVRCDGVLVKPLEPQQVVTRVKELIRDAAARGATTNRPPQPPVSVVQPPAAPPKTADDYFERLDAAFTQRSAARQSAPPEDVGTVPTLESVLQAGGRTGDPAATPPPIVSDALVDEVTRRVAERLGTAALRDVMADVVADVAERLVREEIARIRSKT
jgi:DNA-binding response OmpR family regulator